MDPSGPPVPVKRLKSRIFYRISAGILARAGGLTHHPRPLIRPRFLKNGRQTKLVAAQRVASFGSNFSREGIDMSRRCDLTAKAAQVGHKVSHSNIKTKRRFLANLQNVTMISDALGRSVRLRVSTNAVKSVDHCGGLDAFLLKAKTESLSPRAREIKRQIEKKKAAAAS